jgi:peroxiredoxin Q/BCP
VEGFVHAVKDSAVGHAFSEIGLKFDGPQPTASLARVISPGTQLNLGFRVKVFCDGAVKELAFADLLTRRTIVSIYMRNKTPSCDQQNDSLAAAAAEFDQAGYDVVGVSRDTAASHARYAVAKHISYPLVSDPQDHFARAADALVNKSMYGRRFIGPARAAFILDRDGIVLAVIEKVDPAAHARQLQDAIRILETERSSGQAK